MLYIQGPKNVYKVVTGLINPLTTSIYSPPENFYINNINIDGNIIYVSEENYVESTNTSLGSRIVAINLNDLSAPAKVIYTTTQYVSSLAVKGGFLYFSSETTPDINDNFLLQIHKIDLAIENPIATVVLSNLANSNGANEMAFYNNNLLVLISRLGTVYGFDVTDSEIKPKIYYLSENVFSNSTRGMYVRGDALFIAEGNRIKRKGNMNSDSPFNDVVIKQLLTVKKQLLIMSLMMLC